MASIKDVAQKAGVSISTVSNVINGTKYVSPELKGKIERVIEELEYEVDPVARSLKSKKSMTIGVVITNVNRIFFPQVIKGIQDEVAKNGYSITFCNTDDNIGMEKHFIQMLKSNWVDGIILDSVAANDETYFSKLSKLSVKNKTIPVISLERRLDSYGIDSVVMDNISGASMATGHLIDYGCRKIGFITGPMGLNMVHERLEGYKSELEKNQVTFDEKKVIEGDFSPLSGYQAVKELLVNGIEVDGIFAANDQMAIGAIKAIKEQGYRIPEDIRVVGFDNTFVASIIEPSLTTINVPKYKMGTTAVEMLIKRIENPCQKAKCMEFPVNLITRQSSDLRGDKNWDLYGW